MTHPLLQRLAEHFPSAQIPSGIPLSELPDRLVQEEQVPAEEMLALLRNTYGSPWVKISAVNPEPTALGVLNLELCKFWRCLPIALTADSLVLAMADPWDYDALQFVRMRCGKRVETVLCLHTPLQEAIVRAYSSAAALGLTISDLVGEADQDTTQIQKTAVEEKDAPIIKLVQAILEQGLASRASDIHLEPTPNGGRVRYRIDGKLHEMIEPPGNLFAPVVSRIKVLSNLDVSETRFPQDGRITLSVGRRKIDFRVSTIPFADGEGVVLRILDKGNLTLELGALGFPEHLLPTYEKAIRSPHGLVLVAGPTGSGKSTTLYATIKEVLTPDVKVISVEDPVEYRLAGMEQSPIREDIGYTFDMGLRAILRHDPDIVMIGEMRDKNSAEIAVRTALTGHLVFSTVHTNDSLQAVTRLVDMGVPDYLVRATLRTVLSQRLVRLLCRQCRQPQQIETARLLEYGLDAEAASHLKQEVTVYGPGGCDNCKGLGYLGRQGIYELLDAGLLFSHLSVGETTLESLKAKAAGLGLLNLRQNGLRRALDGFTSVDEVVKVTADF
ncbi:type II/IV secretion system protein [bacterium]|nr:type II/IV secretion system protein [bacterium]